MSSGRKRKRTRSKSDTNSGTDVESRLGNLSKLKTSDLKRHLRKDRTVFHNDDTKPYLKATLALSKLDVLPAGVMAPRDVVEEVAEWCTSTAHGTPLSNLLPILGDGFKSPDGLALTAEPNHALRYAQNVLTKEPSSWKTLRFRIMVHCWVVKLFL